MTNEMRPLCKGGLSFDGSCRHCRTIRQREQEMLRKEDLVRQLLRGPTSNLPVIIALLPNLTAQHVQDAINILIREDVDASFAIKHTVHDFLLKHWDSVKLLPQDRLDASPAIAAIVLKSPSEAFSLFAGDYVGVCLLGLLLPLARFITANYPKVSGSTKFIDLSPEDLYLGKLYCAANNKESKNDESRSRMDTDLRRLGDLTESNRNRWTFDGVVSELEGPTYNRYSSNIFRVSGLQPRIAELVFGHLYSRITQKPSDCIHDMNLAALETGDNTLPTYDWLVGADKYDVKSNLYYQSYGSKFGLNGFIINVKKEMEEGTILPGIVFHDAYLSECRWSFIGFLRPEHMPQGLPNEQRVSPFWFEMPDTFRFRERPPNDSVNILTAIANGLWTETSDIQSNNIRCHPLVPWLISDRSSVPPVLSPIHCRMAECISNAQRELTNSDALEGTVPVEQLVWWAVTGSVFKLRSDPESLSERAVNDVLDGFGRLFSSKSFPVKLATVGGDNDLLLNRWIDKVMRPLNKNWQNIECPSCGDKEVSIHLQRMNPVGTCFGEIICHKCSYAENHTLLTHCHKCRHHPLVIGGHEVCKECHGLRCNFKLEGKECGACKCKYPQAERGRQTAYYSEIPDYSLYSDLYPS